MTADAWAVTWVAHSGSGGMGRGPAVTRSVGRRPS